MKLSLQQVFYSTLSVFLCLFLSSQNYNNSLIFVLHPSSYCAFKSHLISLFFWVCSYEIYQWLLNTMVLNLFSLSVAFDIVDHILFLETWSPHGSLYATILWFVFQLIGSIVSVAVADFFFFSYNHLILEYSSTQSMALSSLYICSLGKPSSLTVLNT